MNIPDGILGGIIEEFLEKSDGGFKGCCGGILSCPEVRLHYYALNHFNW